MTNLGKAKKRVVREESLGAPHGKPTGNCLKNLKQTNALGTGQRAVKPREIPKDTSSFKRLQDRLLSVINHPQSTPKEADVELEIVGVLAAQVYQDRHEANADGFTLDIKPKLTGRPSTDERLWWIAWCQLAVFIAKRRSFEKPELKEIARTGDGATGDLVSVNSVTHLPERWRTRLRDHAAVLEVLHELACAPQLTDKPLSERQQNVLVAMLELQTFSADKRRTTEEIARRAGGDAEYFKTTTSGLRRQGLIRTREGRGGGCWLTEEGQDRAGQLAKR